MMLQFWYISGVRRECEDSVTRFRKILILWHFLRVHLVFGKILNLLWQKILAIGQFFFVVPAWSIFEKIVLPFDHTVNQSYELSVIVVYV